MEKTKILTNLEAKYYSYITGLLSTISNYYNYSLLKNLNNEGNILDIIEKVDNKDLKKYYYFDNIVDNKNTYGVTVSGNISSLIIAEVISFGYRLIEEMGLDDLIIKLNNEAKDITKFLDILEVDYEIDNSIYGFEISSDDLVLIKGEYSEKHVLFRGDILSLITVLKDIHQNQDLNNYVDAFIIANNTEEKMYGLKILQDLRWSEIKAEMDMQDLSNDLQIEHALKLRARQLIILNNEELKKGIVTIKDSLTNEEVKVDETEVLDYIISNI